MVRIEVSSDFEVGLVVFLGVRVLLPTGNESFIVRHLRAVEADLTIQVRTAIGAEEPDLVLFNRTSERRVQLIDPGFLRKGGIVLRYVIAEECIGLERKADSTAEAVASALRDDVDMGAGAHGILRLNPNQAYLDVFKYVRAHGDIAELGIRIGVGDVAFDRGHVREKIGGVAEIEQPAGIVVERPLEHARRHFQEVAPVSAGLHGYGLLEFPIDVDGQGGRCNFKHWALARHRDGLLDPAQRELEIDGKGGTRAQEDFLLPQRCKARKLGRQCVRARRQIGDSIVPGAVGDGGTHSHNGGASRRHAHAREDTPGLVSDVAAKATITTLCKGSRRDTASR